MLRRKVSPAPAGRNLSATVDVNHLSKIAFDRSRLRAVRADTVHVT
jgi:hypothetical protein